MELTINNLIKMIIAVVVLALVILGVYLGMKNYIIPYFAGLGPSNNSSIGNIGGSVSICEDKEIIGRLERNGKEFDIYDGTEKIDLYVDKNGVDLKVRQSFLWIDNLNPDDPAGRIIGAEIEIYNSAVDKYGKFNGAKIGGLEICNG